MHEIEKARNKKKEKGTRLRDNSQRIRVNGERVITPRYKAKAANEERRIGEKGKRLKENHA